MKNMKGFTLFEIIVFIALIILFVGWVKNIIKLSKCDFESPYKCEVFHTIGIIPPLGAVIGYMNFEEKHNEETISNN